MAAVNAVLRCGVASGMLIAFATAPGKTALDGTGAHSPFTGALLITWRRRGSRSIRC